MSKRKPSNIIEAAMRNNSLVAFFLLILVCFGFYSLPKLKKNEFPEVTIRQGVVAVIYPGATAEEIEEQVADKVEQFLFTFVDVDKRNTYSYSKDGFLYVFVSLVSTVADAPMTWGRIRDGLALLRLTSLPQGVLATAVIDDFGNASSLLLAIESSNRPSRELRQYADKLSAKLRMIPEMGNIKIVGEQKEEIAVFMDPARLTKYAISPSSVSTMLALHGFRTISGNVTNNEGDAIVHVSIPYQSLYDINEMVIFSDPNTGQIIRVRDVARVERRYAEASSYIEYSDSTVTDNRCLVVSIEMRSGNNIVAFGEEVEKKIAEFEASVPQDIRVHRITDQPRMVNNSVKSFMKDLVEAILVVILVMLILFPIKTALVSSTSVPVCIAATFAFMYLLGIELNTVTLAALIVVLGMIVDDSVVVIDGYTDMLHEGHSRWYSAAVSTKQLMGSMLIATLSISGMFFPMLALMKGSIMGDFIKLFPWAVFISLGCSFLYAIWVIPYLSQRMIKYNKNDKPSRFENIQNGFFGVLQNGYRKMLDVCFRHKWATIFVSLFMVALGGGFFMLLNKQLLPKAERDSFAVEVHVSAGSSIEETAAIADSLSHILMRDERVTSVSNFIGMASPRFHITYAPQLASNSYAQFIVNTISDNATKEMMNEYPQRYENYFTDAQIRFKQMDYQAAAAPIEFYLKADDYALLEPLRDSLIRKMKENPNLFYVHSDYDETEQVVEVILDAEQANRMGITQSILSVYLSGALKGSKMSSVWEGNYNVPITVYTDGVHNLKYEEVGDILIPCEQPGMWVPLRQVASIVPRFHHSCMPHRNGVRCVTVAADVVPGVSQLAIYHELRDYLDTLDKSDEVIIEAGGSKAIVDNLLPSLILSIIGAIVVMFLVLVIHYGKLGISFLALSMSLLCLFGSCFGLWLFDLDFSITAILGVISLIGIIVRNAIIMYDYAAELIEKEHMTPGEAAYHAGLRRMRPIFLTSATTALGVIPMILAKTMLWMPMGVVICFGTLLTLPLSITVLPVAYSLAFDKKKKNTKKAIA